MWDNGDYLSSALNTTLRTSADNQYITVSGADVKAVWSNFGDWEMEPDTLILHDVIGCGNFGIVWKGLLDSYSYSLTHSGVVRSVQGEKVYFATEAVTIKRIATSWRATKGVPSCWSLVQCYVNNVHTEHS